MLVSSYVIIAEIFPNCVDLLNVEKKNFFGRVLAVCAVEVACNTIDIIIKFQIGAPVAIVKSVLIFRMRYERALSNCLHSRNLGFGKIIQKPCLLVISITVNVVGFRGITA